MSDTVQRILSFEARLKRTQARELAAAPAANEAEIEDNQDRAARLLREVEEIEGIRLRADASPLQAEGLGGA